MPNGHRGPPPDSTPGHQRRQSNSPRRTHGPTEDPSLGGQTVVRGFAFTDNSCSETLDAPQYVDLCSCNAQAKIRCNPLNFCAGSTLHGNFQSEGQCGCEPT